MRRAKTLTTDDPNHSSLNRSQIKAWFRVAIDLESTERSRFLEKVTQEDATAAPELHSLLLAYRGFDEMLDKGGFNQALRAAQSGSASVSNSISESNLAREQPLGRCIGDYQIIEEVGSGGMARVYRASKKNTSRDVALKLIPNLGESAKFLDRFQREYQALALMGHPNIAVVYEAGQTPTGDAWIAMEFVEGKSIVDYCQEHNLSLKERIRLFIQVLMGVQHAHQKAMVHRDLKPSNVMVTEIDGQATVKIIDFGLAKSLHPQSSVGLETGSGIILGTPAYMAPEQMVMGKHHPPDIRSDLYALGLILYQILTGTHALALERLEGLPLDQVFALLREFDAEAPSKRNPHGQLDSDLDRVVLKSIAKKITLRYDTVAAFKDDLMRYMNHEPVMAVGTRPLYLLGKWVKRHKVLLTATLAVLISLVTGLTLAVKGRKEAEVASLRFQTVNAFLQTILASADPKLAGPGVRVVDLLDSASQQLDDGLHQPSVEIELRTTLGKTYFGLGYQEKALPLLERALHLQIIENPTSLATARSHFYLGRVLRRLGQPNLAADHFNKTLAVQNQLLNFDHRHRLETLAGLGMTYNKLNKNSQAEEFFREALKIQTEAFGPTDRDTLKSLMGLANSINKKDPVLAELHYRKAFLGQVVTLGYGHPESLATSYNLGIHLMQLRRYEEAESYLKNIDERRKTLGPNHSNTLGACYSLARCYNFQGRPGEALALLQTVILDSLFKKTKPSRDAALKAIILVAQIDYAQGRVTEAMELLAELAMQCQRWGIPEHSQSLKALHYLSSWAVDQGQYEMAHAVLQHKLSIHVAKNGEPGVGMGLTRVNLSEAFEGQGLFHDAAFQLCLANELANTYFPNDPFAQQVSDLYSIFKNRRFFVMSQEFEFTRLSL